MDITVSSWGFVMGEYISSKKANKERGRRSKELVKGVHLMMMSDGAGKFEKTRHL